MEDLTLEIDMIQQVLWKSEKELTPRYYIIKYLNCKVKPINFQEEKQITNLETKIGIISDFPTTWLNSKGKKDG